MNDILQSFIGDETIDNFLEKFEIELEQKLIDVLDQIQIQSSVKSDRKSLPYKNEIIINVRRSSFINDIFISDRVFRKIISELLNENIYKIRFYIDVNPYENNFLDKGLVYKFRYYIHN